MACTGAQKEPLEPRASILPDYDSKFWGLKWPPFTSMKIHLKNTNYLSHCQQQSYCKRRSGSVWSVRRQGDQAACEKWSLASIVLMVDCNVMLYGLIDQPGWTRRAPLDASPWRCCLTEIETILLTQLRPCQHESSARRVTESEEQQRIVLATTCIFFFGNYNNEIVKNYCCSLCAWTPF